MKKLIWWTQSATMKRTIRVYSWLVYFWRRLFFRKIILITLFIFLQGMKKPIILPASSLVIVNRIRLWRKAWSLWQPFLPLMKVTERTAFICLVRLRRIMNSTVWLQLKSVRKFLMTWICEILAMKMHSSMFWIIKMTLSIAQIRRLPAEI